MRNVLPFADLAAAYGYSRAADVRRCLTRDGIRYFEGKDGPWTTLDLVNAAGGLRAGTAVSEADPYDPDELVKAA